MDELGKIDTIRERLGVSYKEAKDALDRNGGDVVKALIELEGEKKPWTESVSVAGKDVVDKVKEIVQQGNVTKIRIRQGDRVIMDIPVTAGAISTILLPQLTLVGAAVALVSDCTIEIEHPDSSNVVTVVDEGSGKS